VTGAAFQPYEPSLSLCANDRESRARNPGCSLRHPARVPPPHGVHTCPIEVIMSESGEYLATVYVEAWVEG
jgi:hypothetical protein